MDLFKDKQTIYHSNDAPFLERGPGAFLHPVGSSFEWYGNFKNLHCIKFGVVTDRKYGTGVMLSSLGRNDSIILIRIHKK